jgi:Na+-translocating ferredoxin:NAD+ oxidoreductase RnfD subunit
MTLATDAPAAPMQQAPPSQRPEHFRLQMLGSLFPISAAAVLYGWRSLALIALLIGSTSFALVLWRRIGLRGSAIRWSHALWLAILLSLMLPPHLLSFAGPDLLKLPPMIWAILPAAGLLLVMFLWLTAGTGFMRIYPLLLTYLLLVLCGQTVLSPHEVLHRSAMLGGDVLDLPISPDSPSLVPAEDPWITSRDKPAHDALYLDTTAAQRLAWYTRGPRLSNYASMTLADMIQSDMPPLEDLVAGGHPGPLGASSAIAVIIGGLFLMHRGALDFRVPLLVVLSTLAALLLLPVPVMLTADGAQWRSLALVSQNDWATTLTFVSYELMASPLLFTTFYLATTAAGRPPQGRGLAGFALLLGILCAACQLYVSVAFGPYIALGAAGFLTLRYSADESEFRIDTSPPAAHPPTS